MSSTAEVTRLLDDSKKMKQDVIDVYTFNAYLRAA